MQAVALETRGGFDVGTVQVGDCELTFWNEYMTLDRAGTRLGTFPDLLVTLDLASGLPIITAEIVVGQEVAVARIPQERLRVGAGMRDPVLYEAVEAATGSKVITYAFHSEQLA